MWVFYIFLGLVCLNVEAVFPEEFKPNSEEEQFAQFDEEELQSRIHKMLDDVLNEEEPASSLESMHPNQSNSSISQVQNGEGYLRDPSHQINAYSPRYGIEEAFVYQPVITLSECLQVVVINLVGSPPVALSRKVLVAQQAYVRTPIFQQAIQPFQ